LGRSSHSSERKYKGEEETPVSSCRAVSESYQEPTLTGHQENTGRLKEEAEMQLLPVVRFFHEDGANIFL
jgi:hypothetical protein